MTNPRQIRAASWFAAQSFNGRTIVDLEQSVIRAEQAAIDLNRAAERAEAANRVTDRLYVPCPQGADCLSGQKHERIFACEFCENFKGCSDCVAAHEAEAHWTDSDTARERVTG